MITYEPDHFLRDWLEASRFTDDPDAEEYERTPPLPVEAEIEAAQAGVLQDFIAVPLPLLSKELQQAFVEAGVDNIDYYPAKIIDQKSGDVITSHVAFNVVGKISAADLQRTAFSPGSTKRMISADIDRLGVSEGAAREMLVFRLAESVNAILVHERVQEQIEAAGITGVEFLDPEDWAG
jgi:hypothetical protein